MESKKGKLLLRIVLAVFGLCLYLPAGRDGFGLTRQVYAASRCSAYFREPSGTKTAAMGELRLIVTKGDTIVLPKVPEKNGYTGEGWATTKNATVVEYKVGSKLKLTKSTIFYAVRRRYFTVKFNNNKGSSTSRLYTRLQKKVYQNRFCILPEPPQVAGYVNLGWTTQKGKTLPVYPAGTKRRITANTTFYAVRRKTVDCQLTFASETGMIDSDYMALARTVDVGQSVVLPAVKNPAGYTFLGWSRVPGATAAEYLPGQEFAVYAATRLYAVMYSKESEEDINQGVLATGWQQYYRKIIFVGDSRFNRMANTLQNEFPGSPKLSNISFICREGKGLAWLQGEGRDLLLKELSSYYSKVPTAIVFNLGVNDLAQIGEYLAYMPQLAQELEGKNVKLFYMSVNPINSVMIRLSGHAERSEERVLAFNSQIRQGLCGEGGAYTYLDTFGWLTRSGYSHNSGMGDGNTSAVTLDDGLHYSARTYKRIFNYCITMLNTQQGSGQLPS